MVEAVKPAVDALIGIANAYEDTVRSNGQIPAADPPGMRELACPRTSGETDDLASPNAGYAA